VNRELDSVAAGTVSGDGSSVSAAAGAGERTSGEGAAGKSGRLASSSAPAEPAATKKFEAPHRLEKETLGTHVAGVAAVSFWKTSSWIVGHLPGGFVYRIGSWLSLIGYAASPQRRRWLRSNFGHVLGVDPNDKAAHKMARAAYLNYSRYILELMRLPWMKREKVESLLEVHDYDKFLEIYKASKGVILVASHLGNNEAAAAGFAKHGLQINVVGDDSSYRELYELFERQRESWGVKMIAWRNLRGVFGALRRREALVLLVDWGYREDGIPVKMFGAWTTLPAGPAILAAKHGSAIVPFSINRLPGGRFKAAANDPILVPSDSPSDLAIATQKIATALEGHISPNPSEWYIFKPIWPDTAAEQAALETRNRAAMANDAKGAAPQNGSNGGSTAQQP
jgi:lauroyl/myristoyl acyltransferase